MIERIQIGMTYGRSSSSMIPSLVRNEVRQIITKDLLFRLWSMFSQQKCSIKRRNYILNYEENSKESLLSSEVSRFRKASSSSSSQNPATVPSGFLAVYVGSELRRYVIPATYLSVPEFRVLMERAAEEFGFEQEGGLKFPCGEEDFEEVLLKCLATKGKLKKKGKK
ncbi:auxin-responsive protein SAUR71-like [Macadamia integrifolia]|uniref:auxin-responsive protein SAUR71-like n=1 Tax=Macadamia integrifolia TaxID=60698 RepID=UPI001C4E6026|nr:auxin-responsive protein SAUR71-like [Macadamia integrifolia]